MLRRGLSLWGDARFDRLAGDSLGELSALADDLTVNRHNRKWATSLNCCPDFRKAERTLDVLHTFGLPETAAQPFTDKRGRRALCHRYAAECVRKGINHAF